MAVPGAMRSDAKTSVGLHLYLAERWYENPQTSLPRAPRNVSPVRVITFW